MIVILEPELAPEKNQEQYFTELMRERRNAILIECDWTQMEDTPLTDAEKQEWATYRQQLRDFPSTWTPADTVEFPDPPT
jgi:hypothetical protein